MKFKRNHLVSVGVGLAVLMGFVALRMVGSWLAPLYIVTDVNQYPKLLHEWADTGLVAHFPQKLPAQATNVHLSALGASLQGGQHIQLRMKLPDEEVKLIEIDAKASTRHAYVGGDAFSHRKDDPANFWPATYFYTSGDPELVAFPTDYNVYVLRAVDRGQGTWNPSDRCGIAVSADKGEVVYWADR